MNKKGQQVGVLILMAVMIIVGLAFLPAIFGSQADMTSTVYMNNVTFTAAGAGDPNVSVDITGQELIGDLVIRNATGNLILVNGVNVSIAEGISPRTGMKRIIMTTITGDHVSQPVNITMTYGKEGYIESAGSRGVANMIGLFACLAILAGAVYYFVKNGGLNLD